VIEDLTDGTTQKQQQTLESDNTVRCSSYWGKSLQNKLRDVQTCLNNLGFSLCATLSVCYMVATLDNRKKSEMGVSANLVCHC